MASIVVDNPVAKGVPRGARDRHPARAVAVERASDLIEAISEAATIRAARDRAHSERAVPDRMSGYLADDAPIAPRPRGCSSRRRRSFRSACWPPAWRPT